MSQPTMRLFVLGPTRCVGADGEEIATLVKSAKRLALLTYFGLGHPHGFCRRDTIVGLLWPESDQAHARSSLRQSIRLLRRELGDGLIENRGREEVGLDFDQFWCDALAAREALDHGRASEALDLYNGHLLEGFYVPDSPEFERWLDHTRVKLQRRVADAAWTLAETAESPSEGSLLATKAAHLTPYSESAHRRLLRFLDSTGDRSSALREHERFTDRIQREYGASPGPETLALIDQILRSSGPARALGSSPLSVPSRPSSENVHVDDSRRAVGWKSKSRVPSRAMSVGAAAVVGLVAVGAGVFASSEPIAPTAAPVRVTDDPGLEFLPAISPDGQSIVYAAGSPLNPRLYLTSIGGGDAEPLPIDVPGDQFGAQWSPSGKQIAFISRTPLRSQIHVMVPLSATPTSVYETDTSLLLRSLSWSPDGRQIAFVEGNAIFTLMMSTGGVHKVVESIYPHSLAWSPDGSWIAFAEENIGPSGSGSYLGNTAPSSLRLVSAGGGEPRVLVPREGLNFNPIWTPDGSALLFISDRDGVPDLYQMDIAPDGSSDGPVKRVTHGLNIMGASSSAAGDRLAYTVFRQHGSIWSIPIPQDGPVRVADGQRLMDGEHVVETLDVSEDGQWLSYDSNVAGNQDIFVVPIAGGEPRRLTVDPGDDFGPSFSPDGSEVALYSYRNGGRHLYVASVAGDGVTQLTGSDGFDAFPDWAPDGNSIAFQRRDWGSDVPHVYVTERRDPTSAWTEPRRIWDRYGHLARWSPDGEWLAFATDGDVRVMPAAGGRTRVIHERRGFPAWSRDGRRIFVKETSTTGRGIWEVALDGEASRLLVTDDEGLSPAGSFAADAESFYYTMNQRESDIWVMELPGRR